MVPDVFLDALLNLVVESIVIVIVAVAVAKLCPGVRRFYRHALQSYQAQQERQEVQETEVSQAQRPQEADEKTPQLSMADHG